MNQSPGIDPERRKKGVLQKIALVSSVISFLLALVSSVMLLLRLETVSENDPVTASLIAAAFFFICVGIVLAIIGLANLPSFKFNDVEENR